MAWNFGTDYEFFNKDYFEHRLVAVDENGTWNGIIAELHTGRAQVGLADLHITRRRSDVVCFSPSLITGDTRMFVKFPGRATSWTTYFQPFDTQLWIALIVLLFLSSFCLTITYHLDERKMKNKESFTFFSSLLTALGAQMGQGASVEPKSLSSKIGFFVIFFFAIFVLSCFSAKLIVFLSFIKIDHPVKSLEDILETEYSIGTLENTALTDLFENALEDTIYNKIYNEKIKPNPFSTVESYVKGLEKALKENYIYVEFDQPIYELIQNSCDIYVIPHVVSSEMVAIAW